MRPTIIDTIAQECHVTNAMAVRKSRDGCEYFECCAVFDPKMSAADLWPFMQRAKSMLSQVGVLATRMMEIPGYYSLSWVMSVKTANLEVPV